VEFPIIKPENNQNTNIDYAMIDRYSEQAEEQKDTGTVIAEYDETTDIEEETRRDPPYDEITTLDGS
jgi:hypothetical protein